VGFAFKATKGFHQWELQRFPAHFILDDTFKPPGQFNAIFAECRRLLLLDEGAVVKAVAVQEGEDAVISPPVAT
jgi:hypothetical protein